MEEPVSRFVAYGVVLGIIVLWVAYNGIRIRQDQRAEEREEKAKKAGAR